MFFNIVDLFWISRGCVECSIRGACLFVRIGLSNFIVGVTGIKSWVACLFLTLSLRFTLANFGLRDMMAFWLWILISLRVLHEVHFWSLSVTKRITLVTLIVVLKMFTSRWVYHASIYKLLSVLLSIEFCRLLSFWSFFGCLNWVGWFVSFLFVWHSNPNKYSIIEFWAGNT